MSHLQLYSLATPNGQKASVMLEELGLEYNAHLINILEGDQFTDEFIKINPNSKIPALVDPEGDNGKPLSIMESGAILMYLAEKHGKLIPKDSGGRSRCLQWLFFQVGGVGPMFGQFGHFYKYAGDKCDHPYPVERYSKETQRLLQVLEDQLSKNKFVAGDEYTIADISIAPWVSCLDKFYKASEKLNLKDYKRVGDWLGHFLERPAVIKGMDVCGIDID